MTGTKSAQALADLARSPSRRRGRSQPAGLNATVSDAVSLRPCPRQLGGAMPARQLAARSRSLSSCAEELGAPGATGAGSKLAPARRHRSSYGDCSMGTAKISGGGQPPASTRAGNDKEKDRDPLRCKYRKSQTSERAQRSLIKP